jgi:hypothetical protein
MAEYPARQRTAILQIADQLTALWSGRALRVNQ